MNFDVHGTIRILWLAIFVIWAIASVSAKQTVRSQFDLRARGPVWVVWAAWWFLFAERFRPGVLGVRFGAMPYTGLAITVVGLAFAVWARFYIGKNWDGLIALKEDHQLVRGGPYGIVRHPIYSGFMLATFGTALAQGDVGGLVSTALVVIAWGYKATVEETFMTQQFGEQYEQYRREVKGLVPLVW
jgi:protein-S-isoprenylcysteine O-methyltransferase Ste14